MVPISKFNFPEQQQPSTSHISTTRYHNEFSLAYAKSNGNYVPNVKPVMAPVPPAKPQFVMQSRRDNNQMIGTEVFSFFFHSN